MDNDRSAACAHPANVTANYAPPSASLISVTILGYPNQSDQQLETGVRDQLQEWFAAGNGVGPR